MVTSERCIMLVRRSRMTLPYSHRLQHHRTYLLQFSAHRPTHLGRQPAVCLIYAACIIVGCIVSFATPHQFERTALVAGTIFLNWQLSHKILNLRGNQFIYVNCCQTWCSPHCAILFKMFVDCEFCRHISRHSWFQIFCVAVGTVGHWRTVFIWCCIRRLTQDGPCLQIAFLLHSARWLLNLLELVNAASGPVWTPVATSWRPQVSCSITN